MADRLPAPGRTEARKARHLDICLEEDIGSHLSAGFAAIRLRHEALPECSLDDVSTAVTFLGKPLAAPLLISSMTGGTARAKEINRNLALAAQEAGVALALGSQRAALEDRRLLDTYRVREVAPHVVLFANLGAVQFNYGITLDDARRAVDEIAADGLALHFNPLQESLQPHGDTNFRGLLAQVAALVRAFERDGIPVIAKGVGSGIAVRTAARLLVAGVAAIDVAGAGGTSWARIEGRRSGDPLREELAEAFADWGLSTAEATRALRHAFPNATIVASGGIANGVELAKALAIGANLGGVGRPLLEPATRSHEAVAERLQLYLQGFRIALFASGARRPSELPAALYDGSQALEIAETQLTRLSR